MPGALPSAGGSDVGGSPVAADGAAWFFMPMTDVPERWVERVLPMALVPLLPDESAQLLAGVPRTDEVNLRRLVAAGRSRTQMARELEVSLTTVDRRLRRLLDELGCRSRAEAARLLTRKGF
jgi:DNA-binding NarL/FixJ family response regulator